MDPIITAALVSAGTRLVSNWLGGKQKEKGVQAGIEAEKEMAEQNIAFQKEMAEIQREDFAPWRETGGAALEKIVSGIESGEFDPGEYRFDPSSVDVTRDPGYQFRMSEGVKALDRSASARGRLLSGAQKKALSRYSQGLASQEYGKAYQRELDEYNRRYTTEADRKARKFNILSGLSSAGQASAARQAGATSQLGSTVGNILATSGRAQNIAGQNIGGIRGSAYEDVGGAVDQATRNIMLSEYLKRSA